MLRVYRDCRLARNAFISGPLTGHVQLGEFCKKVAGIDSRINTVMVTKETELEGAYATPGQWLPDPEILRGC